MPEIDIGNDKREDTQYPSGMVIVQEPKPNPKIVTNIFKNYTDNLTDNPSPKIANSLLQNTKVYGTAISAFDKEYLTIFTKIAFI